MNKQYVIFDMDGTLVDSMLYWRNLVREFLDAKHFEADVNEIMAKVKTMTMRQSMQYFAREFPFLGTPEEMVREIFGLMGSHYIHDVALKDGVADYLQKLKAQGTAMCVATITSRDLMSVCLTRLGILDYFDFILTGSEVKTGKNTPEMYLLCAERFGSAPADTAVFEDTLTALTTAKKAGFYTIGVYDESEKMNTEAIRQLADEYITSWHELL